MSKIYEAMQRAEEERLAGTVEPGSRRQSLADGAEVQQPSSRETSEAMTARPSEVAVAHENTYEPFVPTAPQSLPPRSQASAALVQPVRSAAPVASGAAGAGSFDSIRVTDWKPELEHLPALSAAGPSVEQFRGLRSRLTEFRELNRLKSVLVTSGKPQEGKTFIAANLALSLAKYSSTRVLLIDGDLRRNSLSGLLGCENTPGLADYLAGTADMFEVMQRPSAASPAVGRPEVAEFTILPGGGNHAAGADLSGGDRFQKLVTAATEYFDWIIVDSSPVNLVTDAVNLARSCDGVLMVVRAGATRLETAQYAMQKLKSSRMLGVVMNAATDQASQGEYYGYVRPEPSSREMVPDAR